MSIIMFAIIGTIIHPHWVYWVAFGLYYLYYLTQLIKKK